MNEQACVWENELMGKWKRQSEFGVGMGAMGHQMGRKTFECFIRIELKLEFQMKFYTGEMAV